jgi:hypothetical protein
MYRLNFGFGVFNTLFVTFIFGAFPQHFWILYIIESLIYFPIRFTLDWKSTPKRIFYNLEYCWVMNITLFLFLCIALFAQGNTFSAPKTKERIFLIMFGTACGPLLAATFVLPLPLLFHNHDIMSSIFIHFFPPILLYILRWESDVMYETWPFLQRIDNIDLSFWPINEFLDSVFGDMIIQYFCWFTPYIIWQVTVGIDLARSPLKRRRNKRMPLPSTRTDTQRSPLSLPQQAKYDTCFHANLRDGMSMTFGTYLWKQPEAETQEMIDNNDFELRDFAMYMLLHFVGVLASLICLAWPCLHSKVFHGVMLVCASVVVIAKGAVFYHNIMSDVNSKIIAECIDNEIKMIIENNKPKFLIKGFGDAAKNDNDEEDGTNMKERLLSSKEEVEEEEMEDLESKF